MTIKEKLKLDLERAQLNLVLNDMVSFIVDAQKRPEDFTRTMFEGTPFQEEESLFQAGRKFFSCGSTTLKATDVIHFIEMAELGDVEVKEEWRKLQEAVAFVEGAEWNGAWDVIIDTVQELA